jgi:hypothetical protein
MFHITNLHTIGNYFTYRMSASVVDTKKELMFPSSELAPLILKLNVTLKLYVAQPEISVESCPRPRVCRLLTLKVVIDCVWRNLKGLSHEIDLAFDVMYDTSSAANRRWLPRRS